MQTPLIFVFGGLVCVVVILDDDEEDEGHESYDDDDDDEDEDVVRLDSRPYILDRMRILGGNGGGKSGKGGKGGRSLVVLVNKTLLSLFTFEPYMLLLLLNVILVDILLII
jgi:hypothetical protein